MAMAVSSAQPTIPVRTGRLPMVAADLDNDGRMDLAVADPVSGTVTVRLGQGDGTFVDLPPVYVGDGPVKMVAADLNGDGRTDLAVANLDSNDVSILLGIGDGTFQPPIRVAVGAAPSDLVAGDFNRDGLLELAVACSMSNEVDFVGDRPGRGFQRYASEPTGEEPVSLAVSDFSDDGLLDLLVANRSSGDMTLMLGTASGRMIEQTLSWPGLTPSAFCRLDTNIEGRKGLGVVDALAREWMMLYGSAQVVFVPVDVGFDLHDEVMDDLNRDGVLDYVFIDARTRTLWTILVRTFYGYDALRNLPPGVPFDLAGLATVPGSPIQYLPPIALPDRPDSLLTGDFNGDGIPDIAIGYGNAGRVEVQLGVGDGTFLPPDATLPAVHTDLVLVDSRNTGAKDAVVLDRAGRLLLRRARADSPGIFDPAIVLNPAPAPAIRDIALFRGSSVGYGAAALTSQGSDLMIFNLLQYRNPHPGHTASERIPGHTRHRRRHRRRRP